MTDDGTITHEAPADVLLWDKNPKPHDDNLAAIKASIEEFGFRSVVVVRPSDRRILAGHGRILAARDLELDTVPVLWAELDDTQAEAFTIADNRIGESGRWDDQLLADVVGGLADVGFNLDVLGFQTGELDAMLGRWTPPVLPSPSDPLVDNGKSKVSIQVPSSEVGAFKEALETWMDARSYGYPVKLT